MQTIKTRAMVETGFLTAGVVILSILSTVIPLLGMVGNLLWPVPIAILGLRHGLKWSVLATVASFFVLMLFLGPIVAITEAGTFGLVGILLGMAFRNHWGYGRTILIPAAVFSVSLVLQFFIITYIMNVDIINLVQTAYYSSVEQSIEMYRSSGRDEGQIQLLKDTMDAQWSLMKMLLPAGLLGGGVLMSYLNCVITGSILRRMGESVRTFPPLSQWQMPRVTLYLFILSWIMIYWGQTREIEWLLFSGTNMQVLVVYVLWVQGLGFFAYFADKNNWRRPLRIIIIVLAVLFPIAQYLMVGAGLVDLALRYRERRANLS